MFRSENWQIRSSYRLYHSWRFICDRKYYVSSFHTYACTRIHFARYYFFKPTWRLKGTKWSGGRGRLSGKLLDVVCGFMGSSGRSFAAPTEMSRKRGIKTFSSDMTPTTHTAICVWQYLQSFTRVSSRFPFRHRHIMRHWHVYRAARAIRT